MKDFNLSDVFRLLSKTLPFLIFRFLIYFGIAMGFIIITAIGGTLGYGIGMIADEAAGGGLIGGLVGFAVASAILYFIREYLLYMVKAGHIAVLVELMDGKELPEGKGQIEYAQAKVKERFVESNVLFGVDLLIKAVIRAFNRVFFNLSRLIPIPGSEKVAKAVGSIIRVSLTFLDEVILAYLMKTRATNPWESSRTALILYAQNYTAFLKNAVWIAFLIWGCTLLVFLLVLAPVWALVAVFPGAAGPLPLILALVLAWGIKQAIIEPIGMTALMQVFFKVTEGQEPNPEWEAKLENVSGKFRELKDKASTWREKPAEPEAPTVDTGEAG